jgi:hypothetical protein
MSPTNTQRRPLKEAPRPRHKSKPKFDMPVEAGPQEAPVGWVYRANEVSPAPAPPQPPQIKNIETGSSPGNPLLMVGAGLFLIGIGTLDLVSRAAHGVIVTPIRFAKAVGSWL